MIQEYTRRLLKSCLIHPQRPIIIQMPEQRQADGKAEQPQDPEQLGAHEHAGEGHHGMKANLAAHDFRFNDIADDRYDKIYGQQPCGQGVIALERGKDTDMRNAISRDRFTPITVRPRASSKKVMLMIRA